MKHLLLLLAALAPLAAPARPDAEMNSLFARLDEMLQHSATYIGHREHRIESVKNILGKSRFTPAQQYVLNQQLIEEYIPYQADSAITYLYRNIELAERLGDRRRLDETRIALGHFYAGTGIYLEADRNLSAVDTAQLGRKALTDYYIARFKLNIELRLYSHDVSQRTQSERLTDFYIGRIIDNTEPGTSLRLTYELERAMRRNDYDAAERIVCELLDKVPPLTREYAIAAYMRAVAAQFRGDSRMQIEWYTRAAMLDVQLAIRDNAALSSLANLLVGEDIQRAMRYMRTVMDDARFFNSRLRPWQDVRVITMIEKAYAEHKRRTDATTRKFVSALALLALMALAGTIYALRQYRRLKAARRELEEAFARQHRTNDALKRYNEQLLELNDRIGEANTVKEEYIGIFLMMCSEYIDKIAAMRRRVRKQLRDGDIDVLRREYASTDPDEQERKAFYHVRHHVPQALPHLHRRIQPAARRGGPHRTPQGRTAFDRAAHLRTDPPRYQRLVEDRGAAALLGEHHLQLSLEDQVPQHHLARRVRGTHPHHRLVRRPTPQNRRSRTLRQQVNLIRPDRETGAFFRAARHRRAEAAHPDSRQTR